MHRDLSPSSVMIDGEGHILLSCFECAEFFGSPRSFLSGNRLMVESESKDYHAPEILLGWAQDSAVDCWGFGASVFHVPWDGEAYICLITLSQISCANSSRAPP